MDRCRSALGDRNGDGHDDFALGFAAGSGSSTRAGVLFVSGADGTPLGHALGPADDVWVGRLGGWRSPRGDGTLLIAGERRAEGCGSVYRCRGGEGVGFALPLELSLGGMPACFLYQSRDITLGVLVTSGRAAWSVPVPVDPALAGYQVHLQSWVLDPPANGLGVITSNGGTATLGF